MEDLLLKIKWLAFQISRIGTILGFVFTLIFIQLTWNYEATILEDKKEDIKNELEDESKILNEKFKNLEGIAKDISKNVDPSDISRLTVLIELKKSVIKMLPLPKYLFGMGIGIQSNDPSQHHNFSGYWRQPTKGVNGTASNPISDSNQIDGAFLGSSFVTFPELDSGIMTLRGWQQPQFDDVSKSWFIRYYLPFKNDSGVLATIYVDFAHNEFHTVRLESNGQGYIATSKGLIAYAEKMDFTQNHLPSLHEIAIAQKDDGSLLKFLNEKLLPAKFKSGVMDYEDRTQKGGMEWRVFSKIETTKMTLVRIYKQEDVRIYWKKLLRLKFYLIVSVLVFVISYLYWMLNGYRKITRALSDRGWAKNSWVFSNAATTILTLGLIASLVVVNNLSDKIDYEQENEVSSRITNYQGTAKYINNVLGILTLDSTNIKSPGLANDSIKSSTNGYTKSIPQLTLNINAIDLLKSNYVQMTGEISIKYPNNWTTDTITSKSAPFFFPDAVEQEIRFLQMGVQEIASKVDPEQNDSMYMVSDWAFSCKLYQKFDYAFYPFDNKQVKLRIQHINRDKQFFIPDFDNYYKKADYAVSIQRKNAKRIKEEVMRIHKAKEKQPVWKKVWVLLGGNDSLSILIINPQDSVMAKDENIRIVEWEYINGRFNINKTNILWNGKSNGQVTTPELVYVVQLKRLMQEPIISNFLPFFVIAIIVFIVILQMKNLGMDHVIGTMIALFFSLLLAHFKLREDLHFHSLVYIEYFYFILYVVLIVCVVNKYFFLSPIKHKVIDYKENMIAKVTYWPVLLTMMILGTMFFFVYF